MKTSLSKSSVANSAFLASSIPPRPEEEMAEEVRQIHEAVTHEEIARRAHEIWEQEGRPHGRDAEHWLVAERQLHGASSLLDLPKASQGKTEVDAREQARAIKASAERRADAQMRN
jgi:hypothetical protein